MSLKSIITDPLLVVIGLMDRFFGASLAVETPNVVELSSKPEISNLFRQNYLVVNSNIRWRKHIPRKK
jgi:hypothetical protein